MKNLKYLIWQKIKKIFNGLILFLSKKKALSFLINCMMFIDDETYGYGYRAIVITAGAIQIIIWLLAIYLFVDVFGLLYGILNFIILVLLFYSSVVIVEVIVRFFIVVVKKILGLKKR